MRTRNPPKDDGKYNDAIGSPARVFSATIFSFFLDEKTGPDDCSGHGSGNIHRYDEPGSWPTQKGNTRYEVDDALCRDKSV